MHSTSAAASPAPYMAPGEVDPNSIFKVHSAADLSALAREVVLPVRDRFGVPDFLPHVSKLHVDVFGRSLDDAGASSLARAIGRFGTHDALTSFELDIGRNRISDAGVLALARAVGQLPKLSFLKIHLGGNQIGAASACAFATPLQSWHSSSLKTLVLHFGDCPLLGKELGDFSEALGTLQVVSTLELGMRTDSHGIDVVGQELARLKTLQSLRLDLSGNCGEVVRPLAGAIKQLSTAAALADMQLNLWGAGIGDRALKELAGSVALLGTSLTTVDLRLGACNITEDGAKSLAKALRKLRQLTSLWLSLACNRVGDAGLATLADALARLVCLTSIGLDFGANCVSNNGLQAVAKTLGKVLMVQELVLNASSNKVTEAGVVLVANALAPLPHLRVLELNLRNNAVGDIGASFLAKAFETGCGALASLKLGLSVNSIGQVGARALAHAGKRLKAQGGHVEVDIRYFNEPDCLKFASTAETIPRRQRPKPIKLAWSCSSDRIAPHKKLGRQTVFYMQPICVPTSAEELAQSLNL